MLVSSFLSEVNTLMEACTQPAALTKAVARMPPHISEYTVIAETNLEYLRISRQQYAAARLASTMQTTDTTEEYVHKRFDMEWDRQRSYLEDKDRGQSFSISNRGSKNNSASCLDMNATEGEGEEASGPNSVAEVRLEIPNMDNEDPKGPKEAKASKRSSSGSQGVVESTPFLPSVKSDSTTSYAWITVGLRAAA